MPPAASPTNISNFTTIPLYVCEDTINHIFLFENQKQTLLIHLKYSFFLA